MVVRDRSALRYGRHRAFDQTRQPRRSNGTVTGTDSGYCSRCAHSTTLQPGFEPGVRPREGREFGRYSTGAGLESSRHDSNVRLLLYREASSPLDHGKTIRKAVLRTGDPGKTAGEGRLAADCSDRLHRGISPSDRGPRPSSRVCGGTKYLSHSTRPTGAGVDSIPMHRPRAGRCEWTLRGSNPNSRFRDVTRANRTSHRRSRGKRALFRSSQGPSRASVWRTAGGRFERPRPRGHRGSSAVPWPN